MPKKKMTPKAPDEDWRVLVDDASGSEPEELQARFPTRDAAVDYVRTRYNRDEFDCHVFYAVRDLYAFTLKAAPAVVVEYSVPITDVPG